MSTPTLQTERLILRKFTENDLEALYRIYSDQEVNRFLPWFPLKSLDEAEALYQERYVKIYGEPQGYAYAICFKEENVPMGYVHASMEGHHDFGYGLMKEFWHCGIVSEAAKAVVNQVKKDGVPFLTATHDKNNPRSGGVMRNIGMTYRYSYEELWQPKNFWVTFRLYQINLDGNQERTYMKYWNTYERHFVEKGL